jgi:hypothetical protein
MKVLKLIVIAIVLFLANPVQAQISIRLNLGSPPQWGPVGYTHARYYYLPDVESYYDVQTSMFIYLNGGVWVHRSYLPTRYRDYDLYSGYKVVMNDYRGDRPYSNYNVYKTKYAKGYHGQEQRTIGQRPGRGNDNRQVIQKNDNAVRGNANNQGRGNAKNEGKGNDKNQGQGKGKNK